MQRFRHLCGHQFGRVLGLVFAYSLVLSALLLPLRSLAEALPDHPFMICATGADINSLQSKETDLPETDQALPHHGCEIGCLMQGLATVPSAPDTLSSRLTAQSLAAVLTPTLYFAYDPFAGPILSQGKAPGAPPLV
jgi:hypothetical protein